MPGVIPTPAPWSCQSAPCARSLADYDAGRQDGRYVEAALPVLPFRADAFGLALCSHFLFLYSGHLDEAVHHAAIRELCRVGRDVRIFPLLTLSDQRSPFVDSSMDALKKDGFDVSIATAPYEFQRGGNQMMRITRAHIQAVVGETIADGGT